MAADQSFENYRKSTRRDEFLNTLKAIVPWSSVCTVIKPHYPKTGKHPPFTRHSRYESPKHPLDHVRPTALGLSFLRGTPDALDTEYRLDGGERCALFERLRAVADLRALAHVLLHRALHFDPWGGGQ